MSERLRSRPENVILNMRPVNEKMHSLLDRYVPKRRPLAVKDYNFNEIQPDLIDRDLLQCLRFVAEVESNPQDPAKNLLRAADTGGATWLRRFIEDIWLPEEKMHGIILRECVIRYGAATEQLIDEEIEQVRQRGFPIGADYTPVKAGTYGWLQEDTTMWFYRAMLSATQDPVLKTILNDLAKQENFHRHVQFQGTKTTLEHNPDASQEVVQAVAEFIMPAKHMTPDLQPQAPRWAKKFNFQFHTARRDRITGLVDLIGHAGLGKATIAYLAKNDASPRYMKALFTPLGKLPIPRAYDLFGKLVDVATKNK